jgi:hypothetical protein
MTSGWSRTFEDPIPCPKAASYAPCALYPGETAATPRKRTAKKYQIVS